MRSSHRANRSPAGSMSSRDHDRCSGRANEAATYTVSSVVPPASTRTRGPPQTCQMCSPEIHCPTRQGQSPRGRSAHCAGCRAAGRWQRCSRMRLHHRRPAPAAGTAARPATPPQTARHPRGRPLASIRAIEESSASDRSYASRATDDQRRGTSAAAASAWCQPAASPPPSPSPRTLHGDDGVEVETANFHQPATGSASGSETDPGSPGPFAVPTLRVVFARRPSSPRPG